MCLFLFKYVHNERCLTCLLVRTDVETGFALSDFIKISTDNQTDMTSQSTHYIELVCQIARILESSLPRNHRKTNFLNFKLLRRTAQY